MNSGTYLDGEKNEDFDDLDVRIMKTHPSAFIHKHFLKKRKKKTDIAIYL